MAPEPWPKRGSDREDAKVEDHDHNHAVAEQVIVSAGNILAAAGFDRTEIAHFFRQAAAHLDPDRSPAPNRTASEPAPKEGYPADMAPVYAAFRNSRPITDLNPLIVQARGLPPLDREGPQLKAAFDLAMQMTPLLAEAQGGLRALAERASMPFFVDREQWRQSGHPEVGPAICLEDFETVYRGAFEAIGEVFEELLRRDDAEATAFLLGHLADNGVAIDSGLRAKVLKAERSLPG